MKTLLLLLLFFSPFFLLGQAIDSTGIKQVDTLLIAARKLSGEGNFDKAVELIAAAEEIALSTMPGMGTMSERYARCCFDRGRLLYLKGEWAASEKKHSEALSIRQKVLGPEDFFLVVSLNNVAFMNEKLGNYEKAEPLYLEAIAILGKTRGKEHFSYLKCLNSLAILYQQMGIYEKAEAIQLEVKTIREKTVGKEHIDYATTLNNLANIYTSKGNWEKAEHFTLEAVAIAEKILGKEHVDYGKILVGLANIYHATDRFEKAELHYLQGLAVMEKAYGKENSECGIVLNNMASNFIDKSEYENAEKCLIECADILDKSTGSEHPLRAKNLHYQAMLHTVTGDFKKAEPFIAGLSKLNQTLTTRALHHLSEREMDSHLNGFSNDQNRALSFVQISGSTRATQTCFDNSLFYKGFLLNTSALVKRWALSDTVTAEKFEHLKSCERRLAAEFVKPVAEQDSAMVAQLEDEANDLEKNLARTVAGFGQAIRQVKWQEVKAALKPNEAVIEFVTYRFYRKSQTDSMMYAALILVPGEEQAQFIPLFEEKQLIDLLQTDAKPQPRFYNDLYSTSKKGNQFYDLIWKPIAAALPENAVVYCSPSGLLHRINLSAIPTTDGKTLANKYQLTMLGSTRQLVVPSALAAQSNPTAQLYGGIQYDATPMVAANLNTNDNDLAARRGADFAQNDSTLRGDNWNYLRWTDVEITAAAEILKNNGITPTLFKGPEASEESFKKIGTTDPSPRILHLATHGFFFPDPKGEQANNEKAFKVSENPMIRSGLVLAGGNHAWKTGRPLRPDLEDGILTAYEISQMNLSNTELVVLSACETGLGDLVGNEGVYGLQRAFKIAGAKYLIMSLWQVPDYQTQQLMTSFYDLWLNQKMSIPDAFRSAQKTMREKYNDPFYWAGFVLVE